MHLVIDVGNTNIVCGIFPEEKGDLKLISSFRLSTPRVTTTDELAVSFKNMLKYNNIDTRRISRSIFSSVVPTINHNITKMMNIYFEQDILPLELKHFDDFTLNYQPETSYGADRLVNAVAVKALYPLPSIVIDFGTAITIDAIDREAKVLGGMIIPGLAVALDSLVHRTSQLPKVEMEFPEKTLGNNTVESMQNGLFFLNNLGVQAIVEKIENEYFSGQSVSVVATGGLASYMNYQSRVPYLLENNLTLKGLKLLIDEIPEAKE